MNMPSLWKGRIRAYAAATVLAGLLASAGWSAVGEADDPILGTWKLNRSKSKYIPGPAPRSETRTYKQTADGIFVTIDRIDENGKARPQIRFPERYDGKEYPVSGSTIGDALILRRINNYLSEATMKHAGKVVATTRRIITDNGKTLILIYQEISEEHPVDNIIVYDRQE